MSRFQVGAEEPLTWNRFTAPGSPRMVFSLITTTLYIYRYYFFTINVIIIVNIIFCNACFVKLLNTRRPAICLTESPLICRNLSSWIKFTKCFVVVYHANQGLAWISDGYMSDNSLCTDYSIEKAAKELIALTCLQPKTDITLKRLSIVNSVRQLKCLQMKCNKTLEMKIQAVMN